MSFPDGCARPQSRQHELAAHVDLDLTLVVAAHAGDQPLATADVAAAELVAEHIYIGRVLQNEVGLLPSRRDLYHMELLLSLQVES